MSDELKEATELLNAYADEFADATIGENTELTSNMQRRLSDAIRVVLAALAKREAVAEGFVAVDSRIIRFLLGEDTHPCGLWFGDKKRTGIGMASFWWRDDLQKVLAASQQSAGKGVE